MLPQVRNVTIKEDLVMEGDNEDNIENVEETDDDYDKFE